MPALLQRVRWSSSLLGFVLLFLLFRDMGWENLREVYTRDPVGLLRQWFRASLVPFPLFVCLSSLALAAWGGQGREGAVGRALGDALRAEGALFFALWGGATLLRALIRLSPDHALVPMGGLALWMGTLYLVALTLLSLVGGRRVEREKEKEAEPGDASPEHASA